MLRPHPGWFVGGAMSKHLGVFRGEDRDARSFGKRVALNDDLARYDLADCNFHSFAVPRTDPAAR